LVTKRLKERLKAVADADTVEMALMPPAPRQEATALALWPEDQPLNEAVPLAELLDQITGTFTRHMVLPSGAADAAALWTAHTLVFDAFPVSPYLSVMSATKGCGKTTFFQILAAHVYRAFNVSSATPATIFRVIEKWHATILLDEGDTYIKGNEALRGISAPRRRGHLPCAHARHVLGVDRRQAPHLPLPRLQLHLGQPATHRVARQGSQQIHRPSCTPSGGIRARDQKGFIAGAELARRAGTGRFAERASQSVLDAALLGPVTAAVPTPHMARDQLVGRLPRGGSAPA
jgi:hypothetical protein